MIRIVFAILIGLLLSGCISLRRDEQALLRELESYGISATQEAIKHPAAAGLLNVLPGFGNFYLASGTNQSDQWMTGFLNFFTWPISILWGIPEAIVDANTINKIETIYYYTLPPRGPRRLQELRERHGFTADPDQ